MDGFERETGYRYYTIPLAADKTLMSQDISNEFLADISYIGTNSSQKRHYFKEYVYPLRNEYYLRLYGQDWTLNDRLFGYVQRAGQYFNIPYARSFQKAKLNIEDEPKIYSSSKISINLHEEQQRKYGGDCNERTFKIPLYGGFEITDDVVCIRKYFKDGQEIIIAKDRKDWFEKIDYYIRNLDERNSIIKSGRNKVLENHTYHNRANLIIKIYKNLVGCS
jgi:spore maturation protein CgeB